MKKVLYLSVLVLLFVAWRDWNRREITHEPGILAPESPQQRMLTGVETIRQDGYLLTPRAEFELRARVLSREDYWWDRESDVSPIDLALGWGVMSDQIVLDKLEIRQGSRWYYTRFRQPSGVSGHTIINFSSNMHMVPANAWVLDKLEQVRKGDVVQLKGFLVDVDGDSGYSWHTSLRRDDTGYGACEIVYVNYIHIEERG